MGNNRSKKQVNWKLWTGLILSALFLYLAFRDVDFARTGKTIASANIYYLGLAVFICMFQFFIRAWRWHLLLLPVKDTGFSNRLLAVFIGFAANCLLPARLGEVVRANSLGQAEKTSKSSVFGTVVVERLFDGLCLFIIFLIGLLFTSFPDEVAGHSQNRHAAAAVLFITSLFIVIFIKVLRCNSQSCINIMNKILFMLPDKTKEKLTEVVLNFVNGLSPLNSRTDLFKVILWSVFLWFTALCQVYFIEMALGIDLPFIAVFIIQSMATLGVMVPFAPGYIGVFHGLVKAGFIFYGVQAEKAISAAILLHGSFYFPTIISGAAAFVILQKKYGRVDVSREGNARQV